MKYITLILAATVSQISAYQNFTWTDCGDENATIHFDADVSTNPVHTGET